MLTTVSEPIITWEKLPDDFPLPDDPVDNINQPLLAAARTESEDILKAGMAATSAIAQANEEVLNQIKSNLKRGYSTQRRNYSTPSQRGIGQKNQ